MSNRSDLSKAFLSKAGWSNARRRFLAGDASDRSYDRLTLGVESAVLMDSPAGKADDPATFVAVADHLRSIGLSSPKILAQDLTNGFLLLEDLGNALYARVILNDPTTEEPLFAAATDVLGHLQTHTAQNNLPNLSTQDWSNAAALALDWYSRAITGIEIDTSGFTSTLAALLDRYADGPRVMILRDYHAENLLWLPERSNLRRVGLLDFQLAQLGQPGYDLVSLLQDARRDVPISIEDAMIRRFVARSGSTAETFAPAYAVLGTQRALRILGVFARLCLDRSKPQYIDLIPRVWGQLQRNLRNPALAPMAKICNDLLPEPTPERLERIRAQCGTYRTP
ncbi:MAG: phosphotransferase [Paracoccaceae bacterium]